MQVVAVETTILEDQMGLWNLELLNNGATGVLSNPFKPSTWL